MRRPTLVLLIGSLTAAMACAGHRPAPRVAPQPPSAPPLPALSQSPPPTADPLFERTVGPMLARTCAPCHIPGGQMYQRLPFDDPETVRSHQEPIRRRLKAPEDKQALEEWLASSSRPQ